MCNFAHMNPQQLIHRYCADNADLERILLRHSSDVAFRAQQIAEAHPELELDRQFLYEAAMLHDIGVVCVDAPGIHCHGTEPYIRHGLLGGAILRQEGFPQHARVAERHTGTGLTAAYIRSHGLPLPEVDLVPETMEEKVICFADKFYSKSRLDVTKTAEQVLHSLSKYGEDGVLLFTEWLRLFSPEDVLSSLGPSAR